MFVPAVGTNKGTGHQLKKIISNTGYHSEPLLTYRILYRGAVYVRCNLILPGVACIGCAHIAENPPLAPFILTDPQAAYLIVPPRIHFAVPMVYPHRPAEGRGKHERTDAVESRGNI